MSITVSAIAPRIVTATSSRRSCSSRRICSSFTPRTSALSEGFPVGTAWAAGGWGHQVGPGRSPHRAISRSPAPLPTLSLFFSLRAPPNASEPRDIVSLNRVSQAVIKSLDWHKKGPGSLRGPRRRPGARRLHGAGHSCSGQSTIPTSGRTKASLGFSTFQEVSMGIKVKLNFGFLSVETDVNLSDLERERWADFLGDIRDYRFLSSPLNAEYVGEVLFAVIRLRDQVLPNAERGLPADSGLRKSYAKMRLAVRNFLTSVRPLGRENVQQSGPFVGGHKPNWSPMDNGRGPRRPPPCIPR